MEKASNVVLNFKMNGQVEYAKTIRDINAIMNAAASEYKTHIAAMSKDAEQTQKLAAEKKKLEIQLEAGRERTKMLRTEYEAMAQDTNTSTGALANKYRQLQNSERAELALESALDRVNTELSDQAQEARKTEEAMNKLESESEALESQTEKLNAEFELQEAQLGANANESDKLKLKIDHLNDSHQLAGEKVKNYEEQLELAKKQYGENSTEVDKYERQLLEAQTAEQRLANEIETTNKQLREQETVLDKTSQKLKETGDKMKDIGKDMSMKVTAPIVAVGGASAKAAIDFESSFADVRKTVDETEEGFERLEEGIRDMSKELPTAATEIAGVTAMAGQLGIANEHLLTFTRTMIDLGVATDMSGEEAATTLARLANITNMAQGDFDRLGSTLVDLGNNFAATESEISEMALRIAGAGSQINMSEADILGFSAALTSVGINAEAGGTAISKLMIEMASEVDAGGERLEEFARVAGMSVDDFSKAFEEDAATAIFTFLGGLGDLSEEGESAFAIIDELGLSEIRLRDTILRTSNAREMANDALATANDAWEENIALEDEAAERYKTTASQLQILKNEITDVAIDLGNILIPMIMEVVEAIKPWIERFKEMDESTQKFIVIISAIAAAIGPVLVVLGMMANGVSAIIAVVSKVVLWLGGWAKIAAGLKAALAALTGPIGLIIAAIAALIAIGILVYKNWDTIKEKAIEIWGYIAEFFSNLWDGISEKALGIWDSIVEKWQSVTGYLYEIFGPIIDFFVDLFTRIYQTGVENFEILKNTLAEIWENLQSIAADAWEIIKNAVLGPILLLINLVTGDMDGFRENLVKIWLNISEAASNIWSKLKDSVSTIITSLVKIAANIWSDFKTTLVNLVTSILVTVSGIWSQLKTTVVNLVTNLITSAIEKWNELKSKTLEKIREVRDNVINPLKEIDLKQIGKDVISGLITGIKDKVTDVKNAVKTVTDAITGRIKSILNIQSPSRVMMEIGRFITEGLGIGIEEMQKYAVDKSAKVAQGITGAMKDGIELPDMEIGTIVRQPEFNTPASPISAISNIGPNIKESLQGLSGNINVNVFLDTDQVNTKLAPGMSAQLNQMNKMNARSNGVIIL